MTCSSQPSDSMSGWMKFGNNKVWLVEDGRVEGTVSVEGILAMDGESRNDAIAEAVTGSIIGLMDFGYELIGQNIVRFSGSVEELLNTEDEEIMPTAISPESKDFGVFLALQYGLNPVEAEHAISSMGDHYENEVSVQLANGRQLRCPEFQEPCSYVRVCVDDITLAYWVQDEWEMAPDEVMGALIGALIGRKG